YYRRMDRDEKKQAVMINYFLQEPDKSMEAEDYSMRALYEHVTAGLPARDKEVIKKHHYLGMTFREIAHEEEREYEGVRSVYRRAINRARKNLERKGEFQ
ncbi:sigma-70 family RNA polymerase sigma factor, partial [Candidatus Bathyarchaeota archaeon]|nr:sigma-70 family RNA polymerase sigma factor [Candidatus Bathyarchaeota archaeon]